MCGIFAYKGKGNATKIVFEGLKKLEYRGYDSWGVGALQNGKVKIEKRIGKIGKASIQLKKSNIAIGHTRWATHGGVTQENAHPHTDCTGNIAVVHNGIIENYEDLKKSLQKKNHQFSSETDTEIFAHLIEEELKKYSFEDSVRKSFNKLKGLSTVLAINVKTGEIIAFKNGSPLVAGIDGDGAIYLSSDIPALLSSTSDMVIIEDTKGVIIEDQLWVIEAKTGKRKKAVTERINMVEERIEKGKFKHFLIKEIHEQPESLRRIAQTDKSEIKRLAQEIKEARETFFTACGTASYAGLAATYMFSSIANHPINFVVGSEFPYFSNFATKRSLLIAGSQSGETMDTLEAIRAAKNKGAKILALVNVPGSSITRLADETLMLKAGPERAVLSTKTYTAKLAILLLLAKTMTGQYEDGKKLIEKVSTAVAKILKEKNKVKKIAEQIYKHDSIFLIGRSVNYPTALEGALKIKESSYIHAEGFAAGELKHGVIALIEEGTPCIVIQANDRAKDEIISSAMELKARGAHIIGIGPENQPVYDDWIEVEDVREASPIASIIPLQLLGYELTLLRGHDPDKPRNLAKSVTVK